MSDKKILSWDDVGDAEAVDVLLPKLSERVGEEVYVKVREILPTDLVEALGIPLEEILRAKEQGGSDDDYRQVFVEHVSAFSSDELLKMVEAVIKRGMVEPEPTDAGLKKIRSDWFTIYGAIMELSMPEAGVSSAGAFRPDGE